MWLTAIFILKIAATPFGLPLLPAKSLVCSGCSLASAVATPPLHYQLFADKGKGLAVSFNLRLVFLVGYYFAAPKIGRHRKVPADFYFLPLPSSLFPFRCIARARECPSPGLACRGKVLQCPPPGLACLGVRLYASPPPAPSRKDSYDIINTPAVREGEINL